MKKMIRWTVPVFIAAAIILFAACGPRKDASASGGTEKAARAGAQAVKDKDAAADKLYNCPMHPTYTSDKPGDCAICGMKLVPVEQAEPQQKPAEKPAEKPAPKKKIMYRSTMNPNEISDKPGKDSMGMDMVPFEVEEAPGPGEVEGRIRVKISAERQQLIGVKTALVGRQDIQKLLRVVGLVDYAEPNLSTVSLKFDGWIETLHVNATGIQVRAGQPLFEIYSPDLIAAEQEYLIALKAGETLTDAASLLRASREKLSLWNVTDSQIAALARTGQPARTLTIAAPVSGTVIEKNVLQGQKVMAGENLFKIADLSRVWIIGEVYEYELPFIKTGDEAKVALNAYPGRVFSGKIAYIYPYLKPDTRTNQVRIEARNPEGLLKPGMFANLEIHVDYGTMLAVPADAVLSSGVDNFVFVAAGDGYFEPRRVKLGVKGPSFTEVVEGVAEGESVVTSANFLIDSESSLKAALAKMTKAAAEGQKHD